MFTPTYSKKHYRGKRTAILCGDRPHPQTTELVLERLSNDVYPCLQPSNRLKRPCFKIVKQHQQPAKLTYQGKTFACLVWVATGTCRDFLEAILTLKPDLSPGVYVNPAFPILTHPEEVTELYGAGRGEGEVAEALG